MFIEVNVLFEFILGKIFVLIDIEIKFQFFFFKSFKSSLNNLDWIEDNLNTFEHIVAYSCFLWGVLLIFLLSKTNDGRESSLLIWFLNFIQFWWLYHHRSSNMYHLSFLRICNDLTSYFLYISWCLAVRLKFDLVVTLNTFWWFPHSDWSCSRDIMQDILSFFCWPWWDTWEVDDRFK